MTTKTCTKCGEVKTLDGYDKNSSAKDGKSSQCKDCRSDRQRAYREANQEEINARNRARRKKLNQATISAANRRGDPWTTEEDHYIATTSDTAAEAAFNLGRTYESVETRRKKLRKAAA